jgi:peptide/nickel transport system permease protein
MVRFIARRLAVLVGTVVVATALIHVFMAAAVEDVPLTTAARETPHFLAGFLRGEFGTTGGGGCRPRQPPFIRDPQCGSYGPDDVGRMMRRRVVVDLQLALGGLVLGLLIGIAAGRLLATRPGTSRGRLARFVTAVQLACPPYFQGVLILAFFAGTSGYLLRLPFVSGQAEYKPFFADPLMYLRAMWIPWVIVALPMAAFICRIADASLRDVLAEDYLRTARSKGLREKRVLNRHALPVAAAPIALMAGVNVATLLMNLALTESTFNIPGMYRLVKPAMYSHDVPVIQAMMLEGVALIVVANIVADSVHAALDPRVRR